MKKSWLLCITILVCSLIVLPPVSAQETDDSASETAQDIDYPDRETVLEDLDTVYEKIKELFVDPEFGGIDLEERRDEYENWINEAADGETAYKLLGQFVNELQSQNTFIIPPWLSSAVSGAAGAEPVLEYAGVGMIIREIQGSMVLVLDVFPDAPADRAGVLIGDVIVSVDGWVVGEAEIEEGSNLVEMVANRVKGPVGTEVQLTLRDPDGEERELTMPREKIDMRPQIEYRNVAGRIAYLRLPLLSTEWAEEGSKVLPRLLSSAGLILDLRGIQGGSIEGMVRVAQWFLGSADMGSFISRDERNPVPYREDAIAPYQRPLVVITDTGTYGVSEILALLIAEYRRGTIVGHPTQGGFRVGRFVDLPSGGILHLVVGKYVSPAGNELPNEGLFPHVIVDPPDLETIRSGNDVFLEKAIETIRDSR
jgi:carboxyl-terminal processing protease